MLTGASPEEGGGRCVPLVVQQVWISEGGRIWRPLPRMGEPRGGAGRAAGRAQEEGGGGAWRLAWEGRAREAVGNVAWGRGKLTGEHGQSAGVWCVLLC